ncbi:ParM/StbA family protein [Clostridium sp. YIM B02551]|uniref:ParM/StbA family protein n=1 Tax=Clostridium sp. YIM B02551 TaxID=2910679 RepID=UPI001EE9E708|nr:ParM/StbA family protein [Clostridium sp. YIM B02551]
MIIGFDNGNINIKTSKNIIYENRISTDPRLYEDIENLRVEFQGTKCTLGQGEFKTNYLKATREDTLINIFTSIALSTNDEVNQVVVGLPIQQFKTDRDRLQQLIMDNRIQKFKLNGQTKNIIISECAVFPESLATYYSLSNEIKLSIGNLDLILIDIGGRTTDIAQYSIVNGKRKLINFITLPAGIVNIYSDFIKEINDKWGLDKIKEDAPKILRDGLEVDGEKADIKFTKAVFEKYVGRIMGELRLNYPIRTSKCILCGGGGILLQGFFRREIKGIIVVNDIFSNAKGFEKVGEQLWKN